MVENMKQMRSIALILQKIEIAWDRDIHNYFRGCIFRFSFYLKKPQDTKYTPAIISPDTGFIHLNDVQSRVESSSSLLKQDIQK